MLSPTRSPASRARGARVGTTSRRTGRGRGRLRAERRKLDDESGVDRLERQRRDSRFRSRVDPVTGMYKFWGQLDPLSGLKFSNWLAAEVAARFAEAVPEGAPSDPVEKQRVSPALALHGLVERGATGQGATGRGSGRPEMTVVIDTRVADEHGAPVVDWGLPVDLPHEVLVDLFGQSDVAAVIVRNGAVVHAPGRMDLGSHDASRQRSATTGLACSVSAVCDSRLPGSFRPLQDPPRGLVAARWPHRPRQPLAGVLSAPSGDPSRRLDDRTRHRPHPRGDTARRPRDDHRATASGGRMRAVGSDTEGPRRTYADDVRGGRAPLVSSRPDREAGPVRPVRQEVASGRKRTSYDAPLRGRFRCPQAGHGRRRRRSGPRCAWPTRSSSATTASTASSSSDCRPAACRSRPGSSTRSRRSRRHRVPVGTLDVALLPRRHRHPAGAARSGDRHPEFAIDGAIVVLVDDVLFTGRTIRAALDALNDYGRPRCSAAGRHGRPRPPRAADPPRLRRQEPADSPRRDGRRHRRRRRPRGDAQVKHLLSIADLGGDGIDELLRLTDSFVEVSERSIPKVPALRGQARSCRSSTKTPPAPGSRSRPRPSASRPTRCTFSVGSSSVNKGESLRDTVETIEAMGVDAVVVRHESAGVPWQIARWIDASIINGGDGWHEHPTQALLDCYTIRSELARPISDLHVAIVGDIKHSRVVAQSNVLALTALGAGSRSSAPRRCCPRASKDGGSTSAMTSTMCCRRCDVVYLLRMQRERQHEALRPVVAGVQLAFRPRPGAVRAASGARARDASGPDESGRGDRGRCRRLAATR